MTPLFDFRICRTILLVVRVNIVRPPRPGPRTTLFNHKSLFNLELRTSVWTEARMDHEFLFNRPPSPTSLDTLSMTYLNPTPSIHSTDSSSSDAASQSSVESPRDWATGMPASWSEPKSDDPWQWMDLDKITGGPNGLFHSSNLGPQLGDSNFTKFEDAFAHHQPTHLNFPSAASPADILGLPDLLNSLSALPIHPQHPLFFNNQPHQLQVPQIPLGPPASPTTSSVSANEGDDIAARAREVAGVRVAISQAQQAGTFLYFLITVTR